MRAFIRALDVRAWKSILTRWSPPTTKDFKGNEIIKVEIDSSNDDDKLANYNDKALNAIFNGVDAEKIKLISLSIYAKKALDILQTKFEGLGDVKRNKPRIE